MIDLVITDVDGVLTDNRVWYSENGDIYRSWAFNQYDWEAASKLKEAGIEHVMLSGSRNRVFQKRANELGIQYYVERDKLVLATLLYGADRIFNRTAFMGNDEMDIRLLERVFIPGCPSDAHTAVRNTVRRFQQGYECEARGGNGALREFVEYILLSI